MKQFRLKFPADFVRTGSSGMGEPGNRVAGLLGISLKWQAAVAPKRNTLTPDLFGNAGTCHLGTPM